MKRKLTIFLAAAALAVLSGTAAARDRVNFSLSIGAPGYGYVAAPPAYYYAPQAYYPPQIYYAPPAVYYAPPARIYGGRGYYGRQYDRRHGHWNGRR